MSENLLVEHKATGQLDPMLAAQQMIAAGQDPTEMFNLVERWQKAQDAEAYGRALAAFQAECPQIKKTRQIDLGGGKGPVYASYDDIDEIVRPILAKHGISKTFTAFITEAGQMRVICRVRFGRHVEENEVSLPVPSQMRVNDTQKMGAALKYGQRYALCAALDLVVTDEDRDAHGLMETITEEQIASLKELVESTNTDLKRFLKWLAVEKLADIPVSQFGAAIYELNRKAAKK